MIRPVSGSLTKGLPLIAGPKGSVPAAQASLSDERRCNPWLADGSRGSWLGIEQLAEKAKTAASENTPTVEILFSILPLHHLKLGSTGVGPEIQN
jgi:hypothetical protein